MTYHRSFSIPLSRFPYVSPIETPLSSPGSDEHCRLSIRNPKFFIHPPFIARNLLATSSIFAHYKRFLLSLPSLFYFEQLRLSSRTTLPRSPNFLETSAPPPPPPRFLPVPSVIPRLMPRFPLMTFFCIRDILPFASCSFLGHPTNIRFPAP